MTYEIEWFVDGKKPKYTEKPYCLPPKGQTKNKNSCPAEIEIRSRLSGLPGLEYYEPGQWVSCHCKVVKPFKRAPLTNAGNKQIDQQAIKSYSNLPTFFHEISFVDNSFSCISQL